MWNKNNLLAITLLMASALAWSFIPITIRTAAIGHALLFNAAYRTGGAAGNATIILAGFPELRKEALRAAAIMPRGQRRQAAAALAYGAMGKFEWLPYTLALTLTSTHLAVMTAETWGLFFVITSLALARQSGRFAKMHPATVLAVPAAATGAALMATPEINNTDTVRTLSGLGAAISSAILAGSHNAIISWWGDHQAETRSQGPRSRTFWAVHTQMTCQAAAAAISLILALVLGQSMSAELMALSAASGILTASIGDSLFRAGIASANTPALAAITHTAPVMGIAWIYLAYGGTPANPLTAAVGATLILAATATITLFTATGRTRRTTAVQRRHAKRDLKET